MELNIAIVDDLRDDRNCVRNMLEQYFSTDKCTIRITEYDSAVHFLQTYRKGAFHIIFLDIYMDEIGGIELSKRIRTGDANIEIIFMSSTVDQMIHAFPVKPAGYLYKPYTYKQFNEAVENAMQSFQNDVKSYTIKLSRAEITIPISEIMSVVANKHTTNINLISETVHKCIKPYSEVRAELLKETCFIECNRGILINMDYVLLTKEMENTVTMQGGTAYPIRVRDRKNISAKLTVYLATKLKGGLNI